MNDHDYTHKIYGTRLTVRRGKEVRRRLRIGKGKADAKNPKIIHGFCDGMPLGWDGHFMLVPIDEKPPKVIPEPPEEPEDREEDDSDWDGPKRP